MLVVAGRRWMPNVAALGSRPQGTRWNSASKTANMVLERNADTHGIQLSLSLGPPHPVPFVPRNRAIPASAILKSPWSIAVIPCGAPGSWTIRRFRPGIHQVLDDAKGVSLLHDSINLRDLSVGAECGRHRSISGPAFLPMAMCSGSPVI